MSLPLWSSSVVIASAFIVYLSILIIHRLFIGPLAKFPGPKLAALTIYYEAYYDIIKGGQYTFKIREQHKEYGESALLTSGYCNC